MRHIFDDQQQACARILVIDRHHLEIQVCDRTAWHLSAHVFDGKSCLNAQQKILQDILKPHKFPQQLRQRRPLF